MSRKFGIKRPIFGAVPRSRPLWPQKGQHVYGALVIMDLHVEALIGGGGGGITV